MIKYLSKSIREYKKDTIKAPIFVTFEVLMEVLIPFIMADLIDFGIDDGNMSVVLKLGIALLIASFTSLMFGVLAGKSAAIASAGFAKNIRQDMFYNVQTFSFSNINKFSTSSIITRLTTDVTNIQNSYQMIIRMAARSPVMIIFSLIAAFSIDKKLSLVFLASIPILSVGLYFIMTSAHPVFRRVFKKYDKLNMVVQENLLGIRVVKSYNREDFEINKFENISSEIYEDFTKAEKIIAFNMPLVQFIMYGSMILLSWFGARAIIASGNNPEIGLSTGQLLSLISYTLQILMSLMMLSIVLVMITISRASAERITELLKEESDLKNIDNPIEEIEDGSICFDNVKFSYSKDSDVFCLDDINFKIESGETVGILGGTGSSKTTLIQLIPRLYEATSGKILVGNREVKDYDLKALRDQVAVVLQKNVLFSGTIKENLRWGNKNASDEELVNACKLAQAHSFIMEFNNGYDTYIERGGTNLSGGQKQRLCIARALLKNPKILILDDSTSAVDTKTNALIQRAFIEKIPNTTKIIIAQRVGSIKDADKIIVMDNGKIAGIGNHETLIKSNHIYQEVFETQSRGENSNE